MNYPIHNRLARWTLSCIDRCLQLLHKTSPTLAHPRSILLCNTAHLGDVILTTSLLPILREAFPEATLGMLVASWSEPIVKEHPLVDRYHLIDHWKVNRSHTPLLSKLFRYFRMRRQVRQELLHYDLVIDCGLHFPNMAPLLWSAQIPIRIGFTSAGFSPLLTHTQSWNPTSNHSVVEAYFSLLNPLSLHRYRSLLRPVIKRTVVTQTDSLILHMGSGNRQKNWPLEKWRTLVEWLIADGEHLLFTGLGEEENDMIEHIIQGLPRTTNLCNVLSWNAFTETIQTANLLIGTDSSAGHAAAALGTPAVIISTGIHTYNVWKPYSDRIITLTHPTPCSPCFTGCASMTCVRSVTVEQVYHAIRTLKQTIG